MQNVIGRINSAVNSLRRANPETEGLTELLILPTRVGVMGATSNASNTDFRNLRAFKDHVLPKTQEIDRKIIFCQDKLRQETNQEEVKNLRAKLEEYKNSKNQLDEKVSELTRHLTLKSNEHEKIKDKIKLSLTDYLNLTADAFIAVNDMQYLIPEAAGYIAASNMEDPISEEDKYYIEYLIPGADASDMQYLIPETAGYIVTPKEGYGLPSYMFEHIIKSAKSIPTRDNSSLKDCQLALDNLDNLEHTCRPRDFEEIKANLEKHERKLAVVIINEARALLNKTDPSIERCNYILFNLYFIREAHQTNDFQTLKEGLHELANRLTEAIMANARKLLKETAPSIERCQSSYLNLCKMMWSKPPSGYDTLRAQVGKKLFEAGTAYAKKSISKNNSNMQECGEVISTLYNLWGILGALKDFRSLLVEVEAKLAEAIKTEANALLEETAPSIERCIEVINSLSNFRYGHIPKDVLTLTDEVKKIINAQTENL